MKQARIRQHDLAFKSWGGKRRGAGRKSTGSRPKVAHIARPELSARHPVHVTLRLREGLPSLRKGDAHRELQQVFSTAKERQGLRLVQYSMQSNQCVQKG